MKTRFAWTLALFGGVMLTGYAGDAHSDTLPGIAGRAWIPSEQVCFSSGWARVDNSACTGYRKLLVPATARWTGTTVYRAASTAPTGIATRPTCRAMVNSATNGFVAQTASVTVFGVTVLGTLSVPADSSHHFDCDLPGTNTVGPAGLSYLQWGTT